MFIREIQRKNHGSNNVFISNRLVESTRTPRGPRQEVVMNVGKIDLPRKKWRNFGNRIGEIVYGYEICLIETSEEIEAKSCKK